MTKHLGQVLDKWLLLLLLVVAIPLLWMFFKPGYFTTHDGDFHLIRLHHLVRETQQGNFPVRIVPSLAEGYGYAALNYFYPLPYLLAMLFTVFGFSLGESIKSVFVMATLFSIGGMYYWLRQHFSPWSSVLGTFLYMYVPYRLVTLYVTGQIGGALAMAILPWILLCVAKIITKKDYRFGPWLALLLAALILAHFISVVMFAPFVAVYALLLMAHARLSLPVLLRLGLAGLMGLLIAGFYFFPAWWEGKTVKLGQQVLVNYQDHWPTSKQLIYSPWGYGYSMTGPVDGLSFQIGFAQWAVLGISGLLIAWLGWRWFLGQLTASERKIGWLAVGMLSTFAVSFFLMLSLSDPVWRIFSPLQYLQYSWRLLALPMVIAGFLAAWVSNQSRIGKILMVGGCVLAVIANRNYLRTWEMTRYDDEHYLSRAYLVNGSTDISWEALPVNATQPPGPAASLVRQPQATVSALPASRHEFSLATTSATTAVLNLYAYPNWQVSVDGAQIDVQQNSEGLLAFALPEGEHSIKVELVSTLVEKVSNGITLVGLLVTVGWILYEARERKRYG